MVVMARTARTVGVSMTPEDQERWDRLRRGRRTSDFVRHLLDLEERDARDRQQHEALTRLLAFQDELPGEWKDETYYDLDDPDDYRPIPAAYTDASVDLRGYFASRRPDTRT